MQFRTVSEFARARPPLPAGVVAVLLCESRLRALPSARRLALQGAAVIVAIGDAPALGEVGCPVVRIEEEPREGRVARVLNGLFEALTGR